ncbi:MAG: DUF1573 domain-containing protein [Paramuribaculum sp.]|nr:DUF1573 domain-containing protein [Paramuribaculum sp.]MDE6322612.1 DUF1573 domain-containing protein [Paramuribaculum sp.]MDE6489342.1 DUF1573 domain-containing protein [Paramuribaculum sp.]
MKLRSVLLAISILCAGAAYAQPKLKWLQTVNNFGAFHEDLGIVDCQFKAVNTGTEPVSVLNARANCGCTRPTYPRTPVLPGDTLVIGVAYDATGRPGKFSKEISIETNTGRFRLLIKGTVIGSPSTLAARYPVEAGKARLSNSMTPFGQALKGRVLAAAVNIYNPTDHDMRPTVSNLPAYINALFRPEVIKPGEQASLSLTAYTDRCPDYGVISDSFILTPDSENDPDGSAKIATTVIVNEDFSKMSPEDKAQAPVATISTETVDFGRLTPENKKLTQSFSITNNGKKPLLIRRIFTADPAISLKLKSDKIKPGKSTTVNVSVDCSHLAAGTPLNGRITVIANDPTAPTQTVRVIGEVY